MQLLLKIHSMSGSLPAVGLIQCWIAFSLQLNGSSVRLEPDWDYLIQTDSFGPHPSANDLHPRRKMHQGSDQVLPWHLWKHLYMLRYAPLGVNFALLTRLNLYMLSSKAYYNWSWMESKHTGVEWLRVLLNGSLAVSGIWTHSLPVTSGFHQRPDFLFCTW